MGVLLWIILLPFRIVWFILRLILAPLKMAVAMIFAIIIIAAVIYLVIKYLV